MTPCSPLSFNRRFGGTYRPHLQGRRNKVSKNQHEAGSYLLQAGFFLGSFFDPEDVGDMFLRDVG
jgi:hypothetical protein